MKTERLLLNKYAEFLSILGDAEIGFKRKEAKERMIQMNTLYKEIVTLRKRMMKERLQEETDDLQMKIKFKKHGQNRDRRLW